MDAHLASISIDEVYGPFIPYAKGEEPPGKFRQRLQMEPRGSHFAVQHEPFDTSIDLYRYVQPGLLYTDSTDKIGQLSFLLGLVFLGWAPCKEGEVHTEGYWEVHSNPGSSIVRQAIDMKARVLIKEELKRVAKMMMRGLPLIKSSAIFVRVGLCGSAPPVVEVTPHFLYGADVVRKCAKAEATLLATEHALWGTRWIARWRASRIPLADMPPDLWQEECFVQNLRMIHDRMSAIGERLVRRFERVPEVKSYMQRNGIPFSPQTGATVIYNQISQGENPSLRQRRMEQDGWTVCVDGGEEEQIAPAPRHRAQRWRPQPKDSVPARQLGPRQGHTRGATVEIED